MLDLSCHCFSLEKPLREVSDSQIDARTCRHEEYRESSMVPFMVDTSHFPLVNDDAYAAPFHISLDRLTLCSEFMLRRVGEVYTLRLKDNEGWSTPKDIATPRRSWPVGQGSYSKSWEPRTTVPRLKRQWEEWEALGVRCGRAHAYNTVCARELGAGTRPEE